MSEFTQNLLKQLSNGNNPIDVIKAALNEEGYFFFSELLNHPKIIQVYLRL